MNHKEASDLIRHSNSIVAFTGAGISTESGIPDFRSPHGVWSRFRMIDYQEFVSSAEARKESWHQKSLIWDEMKKARPNAGHLALARLEVEGRLKGLITQNIDGLHQKAGSRQVIELHGTMVEAVCLKCERRIPMDEAIARVAAGEPAPSCQHCGGHLKPATISFGQAMPMLEMEQSQELAVSCELFLAIGSSLVVYPAASFPAVAKQHGARLIIINRTPTPMDELADLVLREEIGTVLPELCGYEDSSSS